MKNGWMLVCLITLLLLSNVTAQAGDYLYTSDQLDFEYKLMELDYRSEYSDDLKKYDVIRFELSSSIKVYTQDEFEDKLALLSIFINGETANPGLSEIFIYRIYLPVNGVENDLFEVANYHGMGITSFEALAGGFYSGKYHQSEEVPEDSRHTKTQVLYDGVIEKRRPMVEELQSIAKELDVPISYIFWHAYEKPTGLPKDQEHLFDLMKDLLSGIQELKNMEQASIEE